MLKREDILELLKYRKNYSCKDSRNEISKSVILQILVEGQFYSVLKSICPETNIQNCLMLKNPEVRLKNFGIL